VPLLPSACSATCWPPTRTGKGAVRRLMLALYRSGRPADALEAYREYTQRVADDLGIDPGPGLQRLHGQVLARDPDLDRSAPAPLLRGYELRERLGRGRQGTVYAAHMPGWTGTTPSGSTTPRSPTLPSWWRRSVLTSGCS
jgi:hypothetical protein